MRRNLDLELVRRGLATDRDDAQGHVAAGRVLVGGAPALNVARQVAAAESVTLTPAPARFVGRGGEKLAGALDAFNLDPKGCRALDAGASTGGFTDCLLQSGAREVVSLDVGHSQLHDRLRRDARVVVVERTNLRFVDPVTLGPFDAVVADLSFISLSTVMSVLVACCAPDGWLVLLVKPQFEVDRQEATASRGVITNPVSWQRAIEKVVSTAQSERARVAGLAVSPTRGAGGNVEFLLHLTPAVGEPRDTGEPATADGQPTVGEVAGAGELTIVTRSQQSEQGRTEGEQNQVKDVDEMIAAVVKTASKKPAAAGGTS